MKRDLDPEKFQARVYVAPGDDVLRLGKAELEGQDEVSERKLAGERRAAFEGGEFSRSDGAFQGREVEGIGAERELREKRIGREPAEKILIAQKEAALLICRGEIADGEPQAVERAPLHVENGSTRDGRARDRAVN